MNDAPKKRPWFQFSLMTAIMMMLTAGGLLGLNLLPSPPKVLQVDSCAHTVYGWPFCCVEVVVPPPILHWHKTTSWASGWLAIDVLINSSIILFATLVCESLVRRQDRKRQAKQETSKS